VIALSISLDVEVVNTFTEEGQAGGLGWEPETLVRRVKRVRDRNLRCMVIYIARMAPEGLSATSNMPNLNPFLQPVWNF
jgi:hypothetical protein